MRAAMMCGLAAVVVVWGGAVAAAQPDEWGSSLTPRKAPAPAPVKPEAVRPEGAKPAKAPEGWSIVLGSYRGEGQEGEAAARLAAARGAGLSDAYVEKRGAATVVAVGRFKDRASGDAQMRLTAVRELSVDGRKPYAMAILSPPEEVVALGGRPEHNLVKAKEEYGARAKYSLQVAAYGRTDGKEPTEADLADARRAAEEAAAVYRREGELAFYYHSPTGKKLSMVCIGVWNDDDLAKAGNKETGAPARQANPELAALQGRFPFNLVNGQKVLVKALGTTGIVQRAQGSTLVMIP